MQNAYQILFHFVRSFFSGKLVKMPLAFDTKEGTAELSMVFQQCLFDPTLQGQKGRTLQLHISIPLVHAVF